MQHSTSTIQDNLGLFYTELNRLRADPRQGSRLQDLTGRSGLPLQGVYFFCEPGEFRTVNPSAPRIVRVGTHGISVGSRTRLWSRLSQHLGTRHGSGNHRGSIFRLLVGKALQNREGKEVPTWGLHSSRPEHVKADPKLLAEELYWEEKVSTTIGMMRVFWVDVPGEPSKESHRQYLERNAIALLSNQLHPLDTPGSGWLGRHSDQDSIRMSGLWNRNHVTDLYTPEFLHEFAAAVDRTLLNHLVKNRT